MSYEPPTYSDEEIITNLKLKAHYWRQEAKRFAGRPEEQWCLDYAQHTETLAEMERLRGLD